MDHLNDIIFYDGTCGLCQRFVKWVLARDPEGKFHFAPLQGEAFNRLVSAEDRAGLPDSAVVRVTDGRLLTKSSAVRYVMKRLQVRRLARMMHYLPESIADLGYDIIARFRYRLFGKGEEYCPLMPAELRDRFLK